MELYRLTAHELRDMLRKKEVKATELTEAVLNRIEEVDPRVKSFITVCRDKAMEEARSVQEKLDRGEMTGDLAGIPMGLKDNMCTEGVLTTCASRMLENFIPPYDSTVAMKLKEAGTVLVGKLNMDEYAMGSSTESSYFKKTRNPWDLERVPGGSSGGSAAAVAADEAIFTLGSDTGGSIRQPAAFCGVVGLKPTYGAVSRYGLVAFASSLDQIGPITKDVTDCALVMNAISGHDPMDGTSADIRHPDYTRSLVNDVKGLKIALPREYFDEGIHPEVRESVLKAAEDFKRLGAEVGEVSLPITRYALPAYYIIADAEASSNLARYDGIRYGHRAGEYSDLLDLYRQSRSEGFGMEVKRRIMLGTYVLSAGYYDAYYKKALQVRTLIQSGFNEIFKDYDIIITPTAPTTAYKIGEKTDDPLEMYMGDICTVSINIAALPGMVIPCGFDSKKLPVGLQIIGRPFDESTMIRAAYTFEQATCYHEQKPVIKE